MKRRTFSNFGAIHEYRTREWMPAAILKYLSCVLFASSRPPKIVSLLHSWSSIRYNYRVTNTDVFFCSMQIKESLRKNKQTGISKWSNPDTYIKEEFLRKCFHWSCNTTQREAFAYCAKYGRWKMDKDGRPIEWNEPPGSCVWCVFHI